MIGRGREALPIAAAARLAVSKCSQFLIAIASRYQLKSHSRCFHPLVSRHMRAPRNLPDRSVRIVRLTLSGFLRHKSRHLIERQPLDAFGQLRPLAGFNLLQKRKSHPIRHRRRRGEARPLGWPEGRLKASGRQAHHKAMAREDLPEFLRALSAYDGAARTRLALRLALLTFVRTTELRAVRWDEVDLEAAEWRIPAERMKMRASHIVPLSRQAVETFTELRSIAGLSDYVFPSPGAEGFMSNNTMLFAMYRMGFHGRATVHGFRAVASTVLNEMGFHPDWIERQLAHDETQQGSCRLQPRAIPPRAPPHDAAMGGLSRRSCRWWKGCRWSIRAIVPG